MFSTSRGSSTWHQAWSRLRKDARGSAILADILLGVRTPTLDRFRIESPFTAELEGRQLVPFDHPVDGRTMYVQVFRNNFQCQESRLPL